jgi:hypothetical protein
VWQSGSGGRASAHRYCFTCVVLISVNSFTQTTLQGGHHFINPMLHLGNSSTEKLSDLSKVTQPQETLRFEPYPATPENLPNTILMCPRANSLPLLMF